MVRDFLITFPAIFVVLALLLPLSQAKDLPVKIKSVEDDGEVFVHLPVIHSIDLRTYYEGDGSVDLEESSFQEAVIKPGDAKGEPSLLIIKRKGKQDLELVIKSITFTF